MPTLNGATERLMPNYRRADIKKRGQNSFIDYKKGQIMKRYLISRSLWLKSVLAIYLDSPHSERQYSGPHKLDSVLRYNDYQKGVKNKAQNI